MFTSLCRIADLFPLRPYSVWPETARNVACSCRIDMARFEARWDMDGPFISAWSGMKTRPVCIFHLFFGLERIYSFFLARNGTEARAFFHFYI